ncbi:hypothetical protein HEB94_000864 [Actinopolymorpha pittospori]|uniref:Uncharacterized protein n=1 Tax=Actinopolymorpha pittospori TaxID=648752 RepID=A0A927MPI2_9ACTN|nr:hypothetical protein [Actinopolymorpha pittospori]
MQDDPQVREELRGLLHVLVIELDPLELRGCVELPPSA